MIERSPRTYLKNIKAPMMVIQGANDPRVTLGESKLIVEELRKQGSPVEFLVFEDEGHDVIKFPNKIKCYTEITKFFLKNL